MLQRVKDLPAELIQKILIDVPLPELLAVCLRDKALQIYCQDSNFWLARAKARYNVTVEQFREYEGYFDSMVTAGLQAYLLVIQDPLSWFHNDSKLRDPVALLDPADLVDLRMAVQRALEAEAQSHAQDPVRYYVLNKDGTYVEAVFPASSYTEAVIAISKYLATSKVHYLTYSIHDALRDLLENATLMTFEQDLITELMTRYINSFQDGLFRIIPWILQPRQVHGITH